MKKLLVGFISCVALCLLLSGCGAKVTDAASFQKELDSQAELTLERFTENYETACDLYSKGVRPEKEMPVYVPSEPTFGTEDRSWLESGLYYVELNEELWAVPRFFVIPAGERSLSAEEYLELAQASEGLPAEELLKEGRSWCPLAERENGLANRALTEREERWLPMELSEFLRGNSPKEAPADAAVAVPVGEDRETLLLYPAREMSGEALQAVAHWNFRLLSGEEQQNCVPDDTADYETAVLTASAAVREQTGDRYGVPAESYCVFDRAGEPLEGSGSLWHWQIGLCYEGDVSYRVYLDAADGVALLVEEMSRAYYSSAG